LIFYQQHATGSVAELCAAVVPPAVVVAAAVVSLLEEPHPANEPITKIPAVINANAFFISQTSFL